MNHINNYNNFNVNKSINLFEEHSLNPIPKMPKRKPAEHVDTYEIEERTYDLQDDGFTVEVSPYLGSEWEKGYRYAIDISRREYFDISIIDGYFEHLESFMKSKGYILKHSILQSNEYTYPGLFHLIVYFLDKNDADRYSISIINKQI